jgi:hypothetical protein
MNFALRLHTHTHTHRKKIVIIKLHEIPLQLKIHKPKINKRNSINYYNRLHKLTTIKSEKERIKNKRRSKIIY